MLYILIFFLLFILLYGCFSSKQIRTADDYYVAGRKSGVFHTVGSLLATILGSSAILGSIEMSYTKGWAGAWLMICSAIGLLTLSIFIRQLRRFHGYNLPDLLSSFYGNTVGRCSSVVIAFAWVGVIGAQFMGAAEITQTFLHIQGWKAVIMISIPIILYTAIGGQLSIIRTDVLQAFCIMIGLIIVFLKIKDIPCSLHNVPALLSNKFEWFDLCILLLTYQTTFIAGPDIYSRIFCSKTIRTARISLMITAFILIPTGFILAYIGIFCSETIISKEGSVLFLVVQQNFSEYLGWIVYFAMLSAIISSADTTLFTAGELLSQFFCGDLHSIKSVGITRYAVFLLGSISMLIALFSKSLLSVFLSGLSIYAGAFIVPVIWGMFGRKTREKYVLQGIFCGGALALFSKFLPAIYGNYLTVLSFIVNLLIMWRGQKKKQ